MTTLTDFLLARIAEDETRLVHEFDCDRFNVYDYGTRMGDCDCNATARVLAECEAKRRIVEIHPSANACWHEGHGDPCRTLTALALPYADHAEYRQEWKP